MQSSPLLEHLIENLRCLPGVGPKSAQRMAYHLLQRNRSGGMNLARALTEAMSKIGHCSQCRDFILRPGGWSVHLITRHQDYTPMHEQERLYATNHPINPLIWYRDLTQAFAGLH